MTVYFKIHENLEFLRGRWFYGQKTAFFSFLAKSILTIPYQAEIKAEVDSPGCDLSDKRYKKWRKLTESSENGLKKAPSCPVKSGHFQVWPKNKWQGCHFGQKSTLMRNPLSKF